jgi:hypothetical protein
MSFWQDKFEKMKIGFKDDGMGNQIPFLVMGVGDGKGKNKFYITKYNDYVQFLYENSDSTGGKKVEFQLTNDGRIWFSNETKIDMSDCEVVGLENSYAITHV